MLNPAVQLPRERAAVVVVIVPRATRQTFSSSFVTEEADFLVVAADSQAVAGDFQVAVVAVAFRDLVVAVGFLALAVDFLAEVETLAEVAVEVMMGTEVQGRILT